MRNKIPSFIVTIIGLVLIAEYFVDAPFLSSLASEFKNWGVILGAAAIVLGIVNIVVVNVRAVRNRKADRVSTSLLFVALAVFGSLGIIKGTELPFYQTMYTNMYIPMATTIFSMKIFYMLSAAYRSFVAKRGEATVMLGISLITLVTVVSIGEQIFPCPCNFGLASASTERSRPTWNTAWCRSGFICNCFEDYLWDTNEAMSVYMRGIWRISINFAT